MFRRISTYLINNGYIRYNIIDLGEWIGDNSLPWAKNLCNGTEVAIERFETGAKNKRTVSLVYAIDPDPDNCQFISDLACLNNIENIRKIHKAISDKSEILSSNEDLNHCSFVTDDDSSASDYANAKNRVEAWSLGDLFAAGEIVDIAFIHLDVEGMENRVVSGAESLITAYKPIIYLNKIWNKTCSTSCRSTLRQKDMRFI